MTTITLSGRPPGGGLQVCTVTDVAEVPSTVQSFSGAGLTISSLVGPLTIGATGLTLAPGTGNVNFSGSSGQTDTTTGPVNLNGDTTVATGKTLAATGTGNINLPNNPSARFQIQSVSVSADVTASNLATLTAGPLSNADALHTHSGVTASNTIVSGLSLFSSPVAGELAYFNGDNSVGRAIATSMATARAVGVYAGVAGSLSTGPRVSILLDAGLGAIVAGAPVYVSTATAGRGTTDAAGFTTTQVEAQVAILASASGYNNLSGSLQDCIWQPKIPIQL